MTKLTPEPQAALGSTPMDRARYLQLEHGPDLQRLTPEEQAGGWHFCNSWDGMLIHKDDPEAQCCECGFAEAPEPAPSGFLADRKDAPHR